MNSFAKVAARAAKFGVLLHYSDALDSAIATVGGKEVGRVHGKLMRRQTEDEAVRNVADMARRHADGIACASWHIDGVRVDAASFLAWEAA